MRLEDVQARRIAEARQRQRRVQRGRVTALSAVVLAVAAVAVVIASAGGSSGGGTARTAAAQQAAGARASTRPASRTGAAGSTVTGTATGQPGTTPVPLLTYHVIAAPPPGAAVPDLYVTPAEFDAQVQALKTAGWHPVTLDQLKAFWTRGVPLGAGKPFVLTFDIGYRSQYVNALPILQRLGWVADENLQLAGLPPSQGGLTSAQVRGMVKAGWELDTQGIGQADLITLDPTRLSDQLTNARQTLRSRYGVPVNWFCYPFGHYDEVVVAAVKAAGFVGSTTVIPGWASPSSDPYRLPRLGILAGTSPAALLAQIAAAEHDAAPPAAYSGA